MKENKLEMDAFNEVIFAYELEHMAYLAHENAKNHAFYDPPPTYGERILLIQSELLQF